MFDQLAQQLEANHYVNRHGCLSTDYSKIPDLKLHAATTNGTSGIGVYRGRRVYWYRTSGQIWDRDSRVLRADPELRRFIIEPA